MADVIINETENAVVIDTKATFGKGLVSLLSLFGHSNKMFWMGILLTTILQVIPILPTRNRTTGNILSRTFASMVMGPLSLLLIVLFPLLFVPGWAKACVAMSEKVIVWYKKEDLNKFGFR
jgi:ABC-type dipeptide/oligopeptide/nickel transport system permease component